MEPLLVDCIPPPPPSIPLALDPPPGCFIERAVIPAWGGGTVSSVLISFKGPCSTPMDPLQRRQRGATGWVLGTWRVAQAD